MLIEFFKPNSSQLQKYIEGFYVLTRQPDDKPVMYVAFPGSGYFVTINENSKITIRGDFKHIMQSRGELPVSKLLYNFDKPHFYGYEGATSELNICFKPLGINAFLDNKLNNYSSNCSTQFHPFADYRQYLHELNSAQSIDSKIELTENYWLSKLKGFEHLFLQNVVRELETDDCRTITEIAAENKVSRTTLHKQFEEHLCTTPAQFRKVLRFRKALEKGSVKTNIESLTDISYLVNYFDQSHMVKDFKALTNHSPKQFFSKITPFANGKINWMFV